MRDRALWLFNTTNILMYSKSAVLIQPCQGLIGTTNRLQCVHQSTCRIAMIHVCWYAEWRAAARTGRQTAVLNVNVNHSQQNFFISFTWLAELLHSIDSLGLCPPGGVLCTLDNSAQNPPFLLPHTLCLPTLFTVITLGKSREVFSYYPYHFLVQQECVR